MTQEMADIIGAAAGDPGCRGVVSIMREDEPELYNAEWRHCLDQGYVYGDPATRRQVATDAGTQARRAAINAGTVRA